jgi:3-hydroxybutyryl-CoA dehydrogenase
MQIEQIQTILVIGAGTMGSQIALQSALHGYRVNLYDVRPEGIEQGMGMIRGYREMLLGQGFASPDQFDAAVARITPNSDPPTAAKVELVSESIPEDPQLKGRVFAQFNQLCPPETIFTTNTSTLLPSMYAAATGRPDRFAALHFHTYVWSSNVVDVMPHPGTDPATLDLLVAFARRIGEIPIRLERESSSYVFNAMLNPLLRAATTLAANGITSFQNVDRAWMAVMKTNVGPFGILDAVGIETAWHINHYWAEALHDPELAKNAAFLKGYVDRGRLGVKTGKGFYTYPDPEFSRPGFVSGTEEESQI